MVSDSSAPPVPCIICTDPGVDDVVAILLALSSPELLVRAISVTHGNCTRDAALANLHKTFAALELHLQQRPEDLHLWPGVDLERRRSLGFGPIEVFLGSEGPIKGEPVTAKYFHGLDGLSDIMSRHPSLTPTSATSPFYRLSDNSSVKGIPGIVSSFPPRSISYIALGPLSTLAHLHALGTSLLQQFSSILVMGGAVDHPGNTTPSAEFNTFADPFGAQVVFSLGLSHLFLFPLDITSTLTLPFDMYKSLVDSTFQGTHAPSCPNHKPPLTHFTSAFLEKVVETMRRYGGDAMELHDPAVVWALIDWARHRQASASARGTSVTGEVALPPRRGSEMRRRVMADGFTRNVVERRRSVELARMAKLQRDTEAMKLGQVSEMASEDEMETLEADEQSDLDSEEEYWGYGDDGVFASGWAWKQVDFEVETTGTLTRGMLVVDRRVSAKAEGGLSTRQTNRALAIEEVEAREAESEEPPRAVSGARVMVHSPGSETLRTLLLERIWGVKIGLP